MLTGLDTLSNLGMFISLNSRKEQVKENLEDIKSLGQDLKLKDRDISWLKERLRERESEIEQLLYKVKTPTDKSHNCALAYLHYLLSRLFRELTYHLF